jgi:hypothetical protein
VALTTAGQTAEKHLGAFREPGGLAAPTNPGSPSILVQINSTLETQRLAETLSPTKRLSMQKQVTISTHARSPLMRQACIVPERFGVCVFDASRFFIRQCGKLVFPCPF